MKNNMKKLLLLLSTIFMLFITSSPRIYGMENVPKRPENYVYDPSKYLNESIAEELKKTSEETRTRFGIYLVDSLDEEIDKVSDKIEKEWNIGKGTNRSSVLIVFSILDKKLHFSISDKASQKLPKEDVEDIFLSTRAFVRDEDYNKTITSILTDFKEFLQDGEDNKEFENVSKTYSTDFPKIEQTDSTNITTQSNITQAQEEKTLSSTQETEKKERDGAQVVVDMLSSLIVVLIGATLIVRVYELLVLIYHRHFKKRG